MSSIAMPLTTSLTDQLQSAISTASTLEDQLAAQTARLADLEAQVLSLSATNAALLAKLAAVAKPPVDPPAASNTLSWGFVASDADPPAALAAGLSKIKTDGGTWVRLWHSNFGAFSTNTIAAIHAAAALGIRVIVCLQPKDGGAKNLGKPDIAGFVSKNAVSLLKVEFVEVGNELNLTQYRPDDLGGQLTWHKPYVDRWLAPLRHALLPLNVKTLCTSITDTYHPDTYVQQYDLLRAAGAVDPCDGVAVHAYVLPQYLQQLPTILGHINQTWAKPIFVTECNVQTKGVTPSQWKTQFPPYVEVLRQSGIEAILFYRGIPKTNGTWSWPTLFDATGAVTDVYTDLLNAVAPKTNSLSGNGQG